MSTIPSNLKYTETHEWVRIEADGSCVIGITDHAQGLLGDIVFVDLPEADMEISAGEECATIESVKTASDVYSPISGMVTDVNGLLESAPETVNSDAYGEGWLFKIQSTNTEELNNLLTPKAYEELAHSETH
jgi:glycine cleavage system H protein